VPLPGGGNSGGKGKANPGGGEGLKPGTDGKGNNGDDPDEGGWNGLLGTNGVGVGGWNGLGIVGVLGGCNGLLGTNGGGKNGFGGRLKESRLVTFSSSNDWTFFVIFVDLDLDSSLAFPLGTSGDNIGGRIWCNKGIVGWNGSGKCGVLGGCNGLLGTNGGGWNGLGTNGVEVGGCNGLLGTNGGGKNGLGGRLKESRLITFFSSKFFEVLVDLYLDSSLVIPLGISGDNSGGNIGVRISGTKGTGGRKGRTPLGGFGSWSGGGKEGSNFGGNEVFFKESRSFFVFWTTLGFWLHRFGCLSGLNEKKPAENMCSPCFLDFRCSDEDEAAEAIEQNGSLLLTNFTTHPLILLTCLLTENGSWILNSPCSFVFTCFLNLGFEISFPSLHSTSTDAPAHKNIFL